MLPKKTNLITLENLQKKKKFLVCARLYCRKCTLWLFFLKVTCAVMGDGVKVFEENVGDIPSFFLKKRYAREPLLKGWPYFPPKCSLHICFISMRIYRKNELKQNCSVGMIEIFLKP